MKAIVFRRYGSADVLRCEEVEKPIAGDDQVLVRVRASSVNPLDWRLMRGEPYLIRATTGLGKPKSERIGVDLAGEVEAVGRNVTRLRPGDEVFGTSQGTCAEYVCATEKELALKPARLTFEQAASIPVAAFAAIQGLRDSGRIQSGQKVLIIGAAGGIGTFAVQIARSFGAHVTGVCSTRNVDMVRSMGADDAVDYTREDFTRGSRRYDLILDAIGTRSLFAMRRALTPRGIYVAVGGPGGRWIGPLGAMFKPVLLSPFVSQSLLACMSRQSEDDLRALKALVETNQLTPVIDRSYPLNEVPGAIRYLEEGHARGKVVISVVA